MTLWEVFGKWRHFQISLLLWEMQVVRYFLCVRDIGEKSLTRLLIATVAYPKSSHQRSSVKKSALKNFANFTGKHLCLSLFLITFPAQWPATFLRRDSNTGVFAVKFPEFFRNKYLWTSASVSSPSKRYS